MKHATAPIMKEVSTDCDPDPARRFEYHVGFLEQLDRAIEQALVRCSEAKESDLEELRHIRREVSLIRQALLRMRAKNDDAHEG